MKILVNLLALIVFSLISVVPGQATLIFDFNYEYSGATSPAGPTPWLRATFEDFGKTGNVQLTFEALHLTDVEFVSEVNFNLKPSLDPKNLEFSFLEGKKAVNIIAGADELKAGAEQHFDFAFFFENSNNSNNQDELSRFKNGDKFIYNLSLDGLTEEDFIFLSTTKGKKQNFLASAHVQGIGPNGEYSGWVAPTTSVPEPGTMLLLGLGFGLVGAFQYTKNKNNRKK